MSPSLIYAWRFNVILKKAMKYLEEPLSREEITELVKEYGHYLKITADIKWGNLVVGCLLQADGKNIGPKWLLTNIKN